MTNQEKLKLKKFLDYLQDKVDKNFKEETPIAIHDYLDNISINNTI